MEIILESEQLNKMYGLGKNHQQHVLKNINLKIKKGEFVSVMGPSGSGKSTLLYNLSGMDRCTSGRVLFHGRELSSLPEKELSDVRLFQMGFIFQQIHLLKSLSIFDNIILAAYLAKKEHRHDINIRAKALMKKAGLYQLAKNDITQASGGQLQRAAICRALMNQPDIIFGDEPTGALDTKSAEDIMDILRGINESGTTVLLVTHDLKVAAKTGRVLYMVDGRIVGEKRLGQYNKENNDLGAREKILSRWLTKG